MIVSYLCAIRKALTPSVRPCQKIRVRVLKIKKHNCLPMKQIYTTLVALIITATSFAGTITAVKSSSWDITSTWSPKRLPVSGDSIVVPAGMTVILDNNNNLNNVTVIVAGMLFFDNGKLNLDNASRVVVQPTGLIVGFGSNDQISIGTILKFKGTQFMVGGYSFADNTTGITPKGFSVTPSITLPVTFQSFYVNRQSANIALDWVTSQEENNSHFEIERSTDARSWKTIAVVLGAVNSNLVNKYSYTDKNISAALVYYRIRQVDMNGQVHYSAVRIVRSNSRDAELTNIYVSAKQAITIDFNSDVKDNVSVQVVNMNGQVIARQEYKQAAYRIALNVAAGKGVYVVRVSDAAGWSEVKKVVL